MSASYLLYGLRIVTNLPLPGLAVAGGPGPVPLQVRLKTGEAFASKFPDPLSGIFFPSPNSAPDGNPAVRGGTLNEGAYYGFFYSDGPRFAIERHGREVWADWPEGYSLEDACTYLVGPVINFVLRLRGITCLHASSIAVGGSAIAIVGEPGAGKSTTAAAFSRLGYAVLSDDVAALADHGDRFLIRPGYPRVNLWPDSVRGLFGAEGALPPITPTWGKRYLPLDRNGHRFQPAPLPLGAIYILGDGEPGSAAPVLEELSITEAFMALVANTYGNFIPHAELRRREFDVLGRVAGAVPIRRVRPLHDLSKVIDLCELIAADAKWITSRDEELRRSKSA